MRTLVLITIASLLNLGIVVAAARPERATTGPRIASDGHKETPWACTGSSSRTASP